MEFGDLSDPLLVRDKLRGAFCTSDEVTSRLGLEV